MSLFDPVTALPVDALQDLLGAPTRIDYPAASRARICLSHSSANLEEWTFVGKLVYKRHNVDQNKPMKESPLFALQEIGEIGACAYPGAIG
jgi:hypothetical protein